MNLKLLLMPSLKGSETALAKIDCTGIHRKPQHRAGTLINDPGDVLSAFAVLNRVKEVAPS